MSPNRILAKREVSDRIASMPKDSVGKGPVLTLGWTAVDAVIMGRNGGNRNKEGEEGDSEH